MPSQRPKCYQYVPVHAAPLCIKKGRQKFMRCELSLGASLLATPFGLSQNNYEFLAFGSGFESIEC